MRYLPLGFASLFVIICAIVIFTPPAAAQSWGTTPGWYNPKPTINCTSTTYGGVTTTTCR